MTQYEREEQAIHDALERGEITNKQAIKELNELSREYAFHARMAAQEEYDREMSRWYPEY